MHTRTTLQPCKTARRLANAPRSRLRKAAPAPAALTFAVSLSLGAVSPALAGPKGGVVVGGQGTISTPNANTTVINQSSNQLQLNWTSFNVGASESVQFQQPSSAAVAFNRILDQSPSQIFGHIQGNGQVVLVNPNGFLIGRTATLNVNSLVVSSLDAIDFDAGSGRYRFSSVANPGAVINQGTITAGRGGSVTLLGGQVSNSGSIVADFGTVNLAAGRTATLDLAGDGLLRLEVDSGLLANSSGAASAVENTGSIQANGGRVLLTASAVNDVFSKLVNNTGVVRANRIDNSGGTIELLGPGGEVVSSGTLDASAGDDHSTGGSVSVLGKYVGLFDEAVVNVSGATGGGTALIGGDYHGANPDVLNAQQTFVSSAATISADAGATGNGGHVVVWSDDQTHYEGNINARGGTAAGDGGYVEVSGKGSLGFSGGADLSAVHGVSGTILLDPKTITIDSTSNDPYPGQHTVAFNTDAASDETIGASVVQSLLSTSGVILEAIQDLKQTANIDSTGSTHSLTLESHGTMEITNIASHGKINLLADGDIQLNGTITTNGTDVTVSPDGTPGTGGFHMASGSSINVQTGQVSISVPGSVDLGGIQAGQISVTSTGAGITNTGQGGNSLAAPSVSLTAVGDIGSALSGGAISTQGVVLTAASSTGGVFINSTGALGLDSVTAAGSIQIAATGIIYNDDPVHPGVVSGHDVNFNALGDIGGNGDEINTNTSALTATSQLGGVFIKSAADLALNSVSAASSVQLTAAGAIFNSDPIHPGLVQGQDVTFSAANGIGSSSSRINTSVGAITATTSGGNIYLNQSGAADLLSVTAAGIGATIDILGGPGDRFTVHSLSAPNQGKVILNTDGISADSNNTTLINAPTVSLSSDSDIGGPALNQQINVTGGSLTAHASNGGIYVKSQGSVTVNGTSALGPVDIWTSSGDITLGSISSGGGITLNAQRSILDNGDPGGLSSAFLNFTAGADIGSAALPVISKTPLSSAPTQLTAHTNGGDIYISHQGNLYLTDIVDNASAATVGISTGSSGTLTVFSVLAPNSTVNLTGANIADDGNPFSFINARTTDLTATGAVLGVGDPGAEINIVGGRLSASAAASGVFVHSQQAVSLDDVETAAGRITVLADAGDISSGIVSAPTSVALTAQNGAIKNETASSLISTNALTLTAANDIGTASSALGAETASLTATTTVNGNIRVANAGDLTVPMLSTSGAGTGASITTTAANGLVGDLKVQTVLAQGPVVLHAAGAIANSGASYIQGTTLDMTAGTNIGDASNQIGTSVNSLKATAGNGGIYINALNPTIVTNATATHDASDDIVISSVSDLTVGVVNAGGDVTLTAHNGSIVSSNSSVSGDILSLSAAGAIGSPGLPLATSVSSFNAVTGNGGIYVRNTGNLTVSSATASGVASDISISTAAAAPEAGDLTVETISTPGSVTLNSSGSLFDDGQGSGIVGVAGVDLAAATNIGSVSNFATLAGAPVRVYTINGLSAAARSNSGQINLSISGTPQIGSGDISLGTGVTPPSGVVVLQSAGDLNVAGLSSGAIKIGAGNSTQVGLSSGGVLTLPTNGGFTDAPAYSLLVHGTTDIVDTDSAPRDLSISGAALNFQSGSAGGPTTLHTSVSRLDATIGNAQTLAVYETGSMTLGAISVVGGNLNVTATGALDGDGVVNSPQLVASKIVLSGTSLGAVNPLYTQTDSLNLTSSAGGIHIREADAVTLNGSATGGPLDVVANDAMTVAQANGVGVTLATAGNLIVNGTVDGGGGPVSLTTSGANSDIDLNAVVSSPGGAMTLNAAGAIVGGSGNQIVANSLVATGLNIGGTGRLNTDVSSLNATATGTGGGIYATNAGTLALTAAAASGPVDVQTNSGTLTVGSVTGSGVNLVANGIGGLLTIAGAVDGRTGNVALMTSGAIMSNGGHVSASNLSATGSSIGTSSAVLSTTVASLNATSSSGDIFAQNNGALQLTAAATGGAVQVSTSNGGMTVLAASGNGVNLTSAGNMNVDGVVDAGSGQAKLTATGNIVADTGNLVVGASGILRAMSIGASGAKLNTALNSLDAATTNGGIYVSDADALVLTATANNGPINVETLNGDLTGNLTGSTISLTGNSMGSSTSRVNVNTALLSATSTNGAIYINALNGLTVNGSATGGVFDVMAGGTLTAESVSGSGVTLRTTPTNSNINVNGPMDGGSGSVTLVTPGSISAVAGGRVTAASLTATGSSIGSATNRLNTSVAALNTTSTSGGTFVDQAGTLSLAATASGGELNVLTDNGSITVSTAKGTGVTLNAGGPNNSITLNGLVAGGTGGVTLTAGTTASGGAIVGGSGSSVTGSTFTAAGASIGTSSAPLSTNIDTLNANATRGSVYISEQNGLTLANVQSGGDVIVSTASGNITVASVSAASNATLTAAAGAISNDGIDNTVLAAHNVNLLAQSIGSTATAAQRLDINANTLNATATAGGIYIDAQNGLASVSVQANGGVNGNIELMAPNGDLNLLSVSASNNLLLSAGRNILGLPGLGHITARSAELRAGASDPSTGHIGTLLAPLALQLDPGSTLRIFVPQTVSSSDPTRAPATLPSAGVLTTLSLFNAPSPLALEAGFGEFQGLSDSLYTSQAESLVHTIQNQTVVQTVVGLDWGSFDANVSLFGTLDPSVCLPSDQRDEEAGGAGC